jgi:NADPH-dependent glutamate synthase beta subunit-like oxidoreductase
MQRPVFRRLISPCNKACPAGENIQAWLALAEERKFFEAWQEIVKNNPFPACMGRACYHFCEKACNRAVFDETVAIHCVERFLGDKAIQEGWAYPAPPQRADAQKVLVIGAGPSGLSAAYHLALKGHHVTVLERQAEAGGMMRYGIPSYRLEKETLRAEIERLLRLGVTLQLNTDVTDLASARQGFAACYLALGAWKPRQLKDVQGPDVMTALDLLKEAQHASPLSGCVAVYGGGNTAFDAARTAKRLGAARVVIVYRNTAEHFSAHAEEIALAQQENIEMLPLRVIRRFSEKTLELDVMLPEKEGTLSPSGKTEKLAVTRLILAIGQEVETTLFKDLSHVTHAPDGTVSVDRHFATSEPGLFAGGDMIPSSRTITEAIGHGKNAAAAIDAYLSDSPLPTPDKIATATYDKLNTHYYEHAQKSEEQRSNAKTFHEVFKTFSEQEAVYEARRCFSCGNCFMCDTCYGVCPDNAICKHRTSNTPGNGLAFNYDYCKGCGLCARECPCGHIQMEQEEK